MNILVYTFACFVWFRSVHSLKKKVIVLNEDNWRDSLKGEWMIKFYAPWCPACKSNEPEYEEFSQWSDELNIKVGSVDITEHPGLSGRFMVTALPTFYHGKDGDFRRYTGDRKASSMEEFIELKTWKTIEPVSWLRHPNSIQMTIMSALFKTSIIMKTVHETITETYGYSSWVSYAVFGVGTLVTGLTLGLLLVCIIDVVYPPKQAPPPPIKEDKVEEVKEEEDDKEGKDGEASQGETTDAESEASQEEDVSQISSRLSQGWETIKDADVNPTSEGSQVRKRRSDKNVTGEEAGDSQSKETE